MLRALIPLLAQVSPVTAALLLFTNGASGIYQAYRAHQLVDEVEQDGEARLMLADLEKRIEHMPPEQAEKVLKVLLSAQGEKAEHGREMSDNRPRTIVIPPPSLASRCSPRAIAPPTPV